MRRLPTPLLLGLLAAAPPLVAQDVSLPVTHFTLPNGLRVYVHEDHSTPLVAVNLWYHVGAINEQAGRTGFAHLFEHVMFEGSTHVPEGEFDNLLTAAGANSNATTSFDWTFYYETLPSSSLELALWLEADRMAGLLDAMTQQKLDVQRDVVKNERRESYENQPYGMLWETAYAALYPAGTVYHWLPIGSMADLSAASLEDVSSFFRRYYVPNNAVLVVAGDVTPAALRPLVEKYFGWIPRGADVPRPRPAVPPLARTQYLTREDQVTLPQVNLVFRSAPYFSDDDWALDALAAVLGAGKSSRLYKRLVYEQQVAQDVAVFNSSALYTGDFFIRVTAKPDGDLSALEKAVLEEIAKLAETPPSQEEVQRYVNFEETEFFNGLTTIEGKANQINEYLFYTGRADFAAEDLRRIRALTPSDVQRAAQKYLHGKNRLVISFVPQGKTNLAAQPTEAAR